MSELVTDNLTLFLFFFLSILSLSFDQRWLYLPSPPETSDQQCGDVLQENEEEDEDDY